MAINLKDYQTQVEKRLPILFLVDESGDGACVNEKKIIINPDDMYDSKSVIYSEKNRIISSMDYAATLMEEILFGCIEKNIRAEVSVLSYGVNWNFRYPVLKEDEAPYFKAIEDIDIYEVCNIIRKCLKSKQAVLGSILDLSKAILEDTETVLPDRYKPVVIIISTKNPSAGWERHLDALTNDGRSASSQVIWVNIGAETHLSNDKVLCWNCNLDNGEYRVVSLVGKSKDSSMFVDDINKQLGIMMEAVNIFSSSISSTTSSTVEIAGIWGDNEIYKQIEFHGYKGFTTKKECTPIVLEAQKQMLLGMKYSITDVFGNQFRSIKLADGDIANKKSIDTLFIDKRTEKFNGVSVAKEIVDAIKFEPLDDENQENKSATFKTPEIIGNFGDGIDAKGDGVV